MVDEGKLERDQKLASKAKWMTSRGFVYPGSARAGHVEPPPEERVCVASGRTWEEWSRANCFRILKEGRTTDKWMGGKNFDSVPFAREFGGYTRPVYEREYNSHELGDWNRLPRGRMVSGPPCCRTCPCIGEVQDVPPVYDSRTYYKSVHLEPDKAANDKARKDKLHEEWASASSWTTPSSK